MLVVVVTVVAVVAVVEDVLIVVPTNILIFTIPSTLNMKVSCDFRLISPALNTISHINFHRKNVHVDLSDKRTLEDRSRYR